MHLVSVGLYMFLASFVGFTSGVMGSNSYYDVYQNQTISSEDKEISVNVVAVGREFGMILASAMGSLLCM